MTSGDAHVDEIDRQQPVRRRDNREVDSLGWDEDTPVGLERREEVLVGHEARSAGSADASRRNW